MRMSLGTEGVDESLAWHESQWELGEVMSVSASYELSCFLASIADQLKGTESATGKPIKKATKEEYTVEWVPDPPDKNGLSRVNFINVRVQYWCELGSLLGRIANGEDARKVFGQDKRTKPRKDGEHQVRALAYWSVRARNPPASDKNAIDLALMIVQNSKPLTATTVRKYAQRHRLRCLMLLAHSPAWVLKFKGTDIQIQLLGDNIQPLIHYLRKKERHIAWRRPPNFNGMWDLLFDTPKRKDGSPGIATPAFPGMQIESVDSE